MPGIHTEETFEEAIEHELLTGGGYIKGSPEDFDREFAIDKKILISFLRTSQPKEWEKLENIHGPNIEANVINRIIKVINNQGCLEVFRKGFNRLSLMNKWILGLTFISIPVYIVWKYYTTSEIFWPGVGIFAVLLFLILLPVLTSDLFKKVMAWLIVTLIFLYLALMFYNKYQVRQVENDQNSNGDEITDSTN